MPSVINGSAGGECENNMTVKNAAKKHLKMALHESILCGKGEIARQDRPGCSGRAT